MQSRINFLGVLSVAAIIFFSSCSNSNSEGRHVPTGAAFVIHINGKSLTGKLPWEDVKQSELFKGVYNDTATSAFFKSALDDPQSTGIALSNDIIVFAVKDSTGGYMAIEGTIKDESKFKQFNIKANPQSTESEKDGIHYLNNSRMTTAWSKDKFVILTPTPEMNNKMMAGQEEIDTTITTMPLVKRDMIAIATQIFNLKEGSSLGKEEKFTDLMKKSGDIHFWINTEMIASEAASAKGMRAMGPMSMINTNKISEGSRVTGAVNFEDGKIDVEMTSYSSKEMASITKKYGGEKIDADMIRHIPSANLAGMMAFSYKPEGIREYLKLLGLEGFANMGSGMVGFNLDDFIKANKGDLMISVTDIKQDSAGKSNANVIFSTSIGDRQSFNKLIEAGKKLSKEKMSNEMSSSIFYNVNEKYFALGNNKSQVDAYISGNSNTTFDFFDKMSGSSGGAYINFQYILKSIGTQQPQDSLKTAVYDASLKMWDYLIAYGGNKSGNGLNQHIEIFMVDKKTNSLKQLNNYLGEMNAIKKKQDALYKNTEVNIMPPNDTLEAISTQ